MASYQFRENGNHYNGGRDWFGYGYTAIGEPRMTMIRRWYGRGERKGKTEDHYFVDGAPMAGFEQAMIAMRTPPVFTPEELALLATATHHWQPRPDHITLMLSLRDKGAVELRVGINGREWKRR